MPKKGKSKNDLWLSNVNPWSKVPSDSGMKKKRRR